MVVCTFFPLFFLCNCSNTTIIAHKNAIDINAEFAADLSKPVAFNAGYESHAAVAVPPKNSQPFSTLIDQMVLPKGDVLSTITAVKVERIPSKDMVDKTVALDFIAAAATGEAADAATRLSSDANSEIDKLGSAIVSDPQTVSPLTVIR